MLYTLDHHKLRDYMYNKPGLCDQKRLYDCFFGMSTQKADILYFPRAISTGEIVQLL
jgi:hypothetical protein